MCIRDRATRRLSTPHRRRGGRALHRAALGSGRARRVDILPRRSLGVEYPGVSAERLPLKPVGLLGTDASFDNTRTNLADLAVTLARLGEAENALWRLLAASRKTQKRVNALKYNIIPRYQATEHHIRAALEEDERNTLFQIKILRSRAASFA